MCKASKIEDAMAAAVIDRIEQRGMTAAEISHRYSQKLGARRCRTSSAVLWLLSSCRQSFHEFYGLSNRMSDMVEEPLADPAHHRHRHRVSEGLVPVNIGCCLPP